MLGIDNVRTKVRTGRKENAMPAIKHDSPIPHASSTLRLRPLALILISAAALILPATNALAQSGGGAKMMDPAAKKAAIAKMQSLNQTRGYLDAHKSEAKPLDILGGPLAITIKQDSGGVFVALPGKRALDPVIFGPKKMPRHYAGTPMITGVPPMLRAPKEGGGQQTAVPTPFGNKYVVMGNGKLSISALDATATDAATTKDSVRMMASWQDKDGNTYAVKCCLKMAAHGIEFPTFGGVATNTLMHGFTGVGTPLMPTEFAYFAFWGMGEIDKNGKTLDKPRLVHGMLTEYVRKDGYRLGFDRDVTPGRQQFHLMVAPFAPDMKNGVFMKKPVNTGLTLPNGMTLPFWHVMFENLDVNAKRESNNAH
ncbi:MAG: hypothetical protein COA84_09435 [Robiginitomaculum sp.]|nr:MAG: hypothetical protein COA84_09435 [Robiginitomaculum sp.]